MNAHLSLHSVVRIEVDNINDNSDTRWREVRFVDADGSVFSVAAFAKHGGDIKVEVNPLDLVASRGRQAQECAA